MRKTIIYSDETKAKFIGQNSKPIAGKHQALLITWLIIYSIVKRWQHLVMGAFLSSTNRSKLMEEWKQPNTVRSWKRICSRIFRTSDWGSGSSFSTPIMTIIRPRQCCSGFGEKKSECPWVAHSSYPITSLHLKMEILRVQSVQRLVKDLELALPVTWSEINDHVNKLLSVPLRV